MDQNINAYRIDYMRKTGGGVFSLGDVLIQNAWILAGGKGSALDQLDFRKAVVMSYLRRFQAQPKCSDKKQKPCPGDSDMQ